jgi:phage host-nuclease inhibitor protein Gam
VELYLYSRCTASWRKQRQLYKRNTRSAEWSDEVADVSEDTNVVFQNSIHEEIKSSLKPRNAWCHSAQDLLSSSLLPKNIKIHRTIILYGVLYGCETWPLALREEGF